jgi:hypothetical protein
MALEVRDPDQIVGNAPEPVAFTRSLGDLLFQRFVERAQRLFGAAAVGDVDMRADETQRLAVGRALDLGRDMNPAHLPVARPHDAVLGAIFGPAAVDGLEEMPQRGRAIVGMDAPRPILMGVDPRIRRQSVDAQVFR